MIGLSLDIVGAFLVAVEAIKLENLRILRDRVLKPARRYTLSPRINWVDASGRPLGVWQAPVPADLYPAIFTGLHYIAGLSLVIVANGASGGIVFHWLSRAGLWAMDRPWYVTTLCALAFVLYGVVGGLWMLGELVHVALTRMVTACISVLDFIDTRTPSGTVGIIGFLLVLAGFIF